MRAGSLVRVLLDKGADPNAADTSRDTPLHKAALDGAAAAAELLLAHGADPRAKRFNGMTPAQCARLRGHDDLSRLIDGHR